MNNKEKNNNMPSAPVDPDKGKGLMYFLLGVAIGLAFVLLVMLLSGCAPPAPPMLPPASALDEPRGWDGETSGSRPVATFGRCNVYKFSDTDATCYVTCKANIACVGR